MKIKTGMDLEKTLFCGQFFRTQALDGGYLVYFKDQRIWVGQGDGWIEVQGQVARQDLEDFFDLNRDYQAVEKALASHEFLQPALEAASGIHILRQDLWEVVVSFIISANSNIPRIRKSLFALCQNYGDQKQDQWGTYYSFPRPQDLAGVCREDFREKIKLGYRDQYLVKTTQQVLEGQVDLEALKEVVDKELAMKELTRLSGVGPKVAHCILLFGLHNWQGFPVDVWMKRALKEHFPKIPEKDYESLAQDLFGPYAGYAQQALFYHAKLNQMGG